MVARYSGEPNSMVYFTDFSVVVHEADDLGT
jgi:hypothetical protein